MGELVLPLVCSEGVSSVVVMPPHSLPPAAVGRTGPEIMKIGKLSVSCLGNTVKLAKVAKSRVSQV